MSDISFKRKKARKKVEGITFDIDGVEFTTVVASVPTGMGLQLADVDLADAGRMINNFFQLVLGEDQFKLFIDTLNDPAYESPDLVEMLKDVSKEMAGRFQK